MKARLLRGVVFVVYLVLGSAAFFFLFGTAMFVDIYEGLTGWVIRIVVVGFVGPFFLAMVPSITWPESFRIWCLAYPFPTLAMAALFILSAFGRDGPFAFLFWSSCGAGMVAASLAGGWVGRKRGLPRWRRQRGQCLQCGYDLRGTEHDVCPECGATANRSQ